MGGEILLGARFALQVNAVCLMRGTGTESKYLFLDLEGSPHRGGSPLATLEAVDLAS